MKIVAAAVLAAACHAQVSITEEEGRRLQQDWSGFQRVPQQNWEEEKRPQRSQRRTRRSKKQRRKKRRGRGSGDGNPDTDTGGRQRPVTPEKQCNGQNIPKGPQNRIERQAFNTQNKIRQKPKRMSIYVGNQYRNFERNKKILVLKDGTRLQTQEGRRAWKEAYRVMQRSKGVAPLQWSDGLAKAARDHCEDQGPKGSMGHTGSDGSSPTKRMERYGSWSRSTAENLAWGGSDGTGFMYQLYIDDGVANRGHRKNIKNPALKRTGIAFCKHAQLKGMIAIAYAGGYEECTGSDSVPTPEKPVTPVVVTPTAPTPTTTTSQLACVKPKSVGQCGKCQTKDQCKTGYCCPFMKKCVNTGRDPCRYPIANCRPMCYDSKDQSKCRCKNKDYPGNWVGKSCASGQEPTIKETVKPKNFGQWKKCAQEWGICNCGKGGKIGYGDPKWVKNGRKVNKRLAVKRNVDRLDCTNRVFGDPVPGVVKVCWCKKSDSGTKPTIPNKPDPTSVKVDGSTLACVPEKSVGQCGKCQSKDQCKTGYCCPYMKKCVNSGSDQCYYPIANCRPMCYDRANQERCSCNEEYPKKWIGKTCPSDSGSGSGSGSSEEEDPNSDSGDTDTPKPPTSGSNKMAGPEEWAAFNEQNRIRTNPKDVQKVVTEQISRFDGNSIMRRPGGINLRTNAGIGEWKEAEEVLGKQGTFPKMEWNDYLALAAEDHCKQMGPEGRTGHGGTDNSKPWDRMRRYGDWGGTVGENIAYGQSGGKDYMVQLYIDDGVANRGHRVNILKKEFKLTGMAVCYHKKYGQQIVINYAGSFTPNQHGIDSLRARAKN